jgi:hypothetical protein
VLTYDIGAAAEVLADPAQIMPVTNAHSVLRRSADLLLLFDSIAERILAWRSGERPRTSPDPRFYLTTVAQQWRTMFSS